MFAKSKKLLRIQLRELHRGELSSQERVSEYELPEETATHVQHWFPRLRLFMLQHELSEQDILLYIALSLLVGFSALVIGVLFAWYLGVAVVIGYGVFVKAVLKKRMDERTAKYAVDLPTLLLAMAANMKIGLTAYASLERSSRLFSSDSPLRRDVVALREALQAGVPAKDAIGVFGPGLPLAEVSLFRSAFLLVLEHGGQFAPTLERLARIGRERALLAQSLKSRTSGMRMTAYVLLAVVPLLLVMLSTRIDDFWTILFTHSTAKLVASIGVMFIASGVFVLRRMGTLRV